MGLYVLITLNLLDINFQISHSVAKYIPVNISNLAAKNIYFFIMFVYLFIYLHLMMTHYPKHAV
jgi:hypothetical protein